MAIFAGNQSNALQSIAPTHHPQYSPLRYIAPFLICFIFTIGLLGNLCIIVILRRRPRRQHQDSNPSHPVRPQILQCMAFADMLLLLFVCHLSALEFAQESWTLGTLLCQIMRPIEFVVQMVTALSLCGLSLDICLVAAFPERYVAWRSGVKTSIACLGTWMISVLSALPLWLHAKSLATPDGFTFCTIIWPEECGLNCLLYTSILGFGLPLVITIIALIWIVNSSNYCNFWRPGTPKSSRTNSRDDKQVIRLLSSLTAVFIVLWLPYNIVPFFRSIYSASKLTHVEMRLYTTVACYAYSSCCVKPLLYICHHPAIRNGFVDIVPRNSDNPEIRSIRGSFRYRDRVIGAGVIKTSKCKKNGAVFWSIHGFPGSVIAVEDHHGTCTPASNRRRTF